MAEEILPIMNVDDDDDSTTGEKSPRKPALSSPTNQREGEDLPVMNVGDADSNNDESYSSHLSSPSNQHASKGHLPIFNSNDESSDDENLPIMNFGDSDSNDESSSSHLSPSSIQHTDKGYLPILKVDDDSTDNESYPVKLNKREMPNTGKDFANDNTSAKLEERAISSLPVPGVKRKHCEKNYSRGHLHLPSIQHADKGYLPILKVDDDSTDDESCPVKLNKRDMINTGKDLANDSTSAKLEDREMSISSMPVPGIKKKHCARKII